MKHIVKTKISDSNWANIKSLIFDMPTQCTTFICYANLKTKSVQCKLEYGHEGVHYYA
jgi:hypothetical protein